MSRRYTEQELAEVLRLHSAWFSGEPEGVRADLSGANLSNANLSWANLSRANLSEADISNANLSNANLSNANLSWANLSWANLSRANLSEADISNANLSNANLSNANLSWANLSGADLSGADTRGAGLYVSSACGILGVDIYVAQLGNRRLVYRGDTGDIKIGCQQHSVDSWLEKGTKIGVSAGWSMPDIDLYMSVISAISKRRKIK